MRTLPRCPYTFQYLSWLKDQQAYQRDLCDFGCDQRYLGFICVDQLGTLLQTDFITHKFGHVLSQYGLKSVRFHDLRGTTLPDGFESDNQDEQITHLRFLEIQGLIV